MIDVSPRPRRGKRGSTCACRSPSATFWSGPPSSTGTGWPSSTNPASPGSLGSHHLRRDAGPGPGHGPGPRGHGRRPRRTGGHREPELGPLPHLLLRGERLRAGPRPHQLPAERRRGGLHRRALGGQGPARRSRARRAAGRGGGAQPRSSSTAHDDAELFAPAAPAGGPTGRGPADEDATCSINYTSGTTARPKGRRAHPPHLLAERGQLRLAHHGHRPRRPAAHPAHVPLQRLGHALRGDGHGRPPRRAAQGRRRGDPAAGGDRRGDPAVRGAGRGGRHPRRPPPTGWRPAGPCPGGAGCAWWWPAPPRRRRRSSGSRPSWAGSSSRSTA